MSSRKHPDHYTRKAKAEGFAARSVFKLDEINQKHRVFKSGQTVLDLGCAPGSWLQYIARKVGPRGRVVGIDRTEVHLEAAHITTIQGDIYATPAQAFFEAGRGRFDVITSDMAPDTCGNRFADHVRSVELCLRALNLTGRLLKKGGHFVCKVFEGEDVSTLVDAMKVAFGRVKRVKPRSTRAESVEFFLVGLGKLNAPEDPAGDHVELEPDAPDELTTELLDTIRRQGLDPQVVHEHRKWLQSGEDLVARNRVTGALRSPQAGEYLDRSHFQYDDALIDDAHQTIARGAVALLVLNGGMATRFGGVVKGGLQVDQGLSFLALKIRNALKIAEALDAEPPVIILMNSTQTHDATMEHLKAHGFFGYPEDRIWTMCQSVSVRFTEDGRLFRSDSGDVSLYSPGHGDALYMPGVSGLLPRMKAAGIEVVLLSNVDNVLATLDPTLLGLHRAMGFPVSVELVDAFDGDTGGAPYWHRGRLQLIEGFRLDTQAAPQLTVFNTNTFWLNVSVLETPPALTWFAVQKNVDGRPAIQFERLVGEVTCHVDAQYVRVAREGLESRFIPVKTPEDLERHRVDIMNIWTIRSGES